MINLRHNVDVPVDIPHRTGCLCISPVLLQELITFVQRVLVVADDFRERPLVSAQNIAVLSTVLVERGLGLRDSILKRLEASV
jgi:hypothetical protein